MLAFSSSTVSPNSFTLWTSIFLLVGSVVSLYSLSLVGSIVGGLFLTLMPLLLAGAGDWVPIRSEEHTSELQSLMRISYAVFCLKKKKTQDNIHHIYIS